MRPILSFALLTALASAPAGGQSVIQPAEPWPADGPNAQAAQRPLGPNARLAQRVTGPNAALARKDGVIGGQVHYPSCSAAGAVRATPVRRGEPGYGRHLDRDGDGVACE
jgi:hypothetical protein